MQASAMAFCGRTVRNSDVHAVVCKGDCHVGFAAAEGRLKHRALEEALVSRRFQAEHDLTKCQNFHDCSSSLLQQMHGKAAELIFEVCNCHTSVLYFAEPSSYAKPFFASSATASSTELVRIAI